MATKNKCNISRQKARRVLELLKFLTKLNKNNQETALKFFNNEGLDYISETIFNILYNPDCTLTLTKSKRSGVVNILKPRCHILRKFKKNYPIVSKQKKIVQSGSGISLLLSAAILFLISLLSPKNEKRYW